MWYTIGQELNELMFKRIHNAKFYVIPPKIANFYYGYTMVI